MALEKTMDMARSALNTMFENHKNNISKVVETDYECSISISLKIERLNNGKMSVKHGIKYVTGQVKDNDQMVFDDQQMPLFDE